jgi:hypothetical protein
MGHICDSSYILVLYQIRFIIIRINSGKVGVIVWREIHTVCCGDNTFRLSSKKFFLQLQWSQLSSKHPFTFGTVATLSSHWCIHCKQSSSNHHHHDWNQPPSTDIGSPSCHPVFLTDDHISCCCWQNNGWFIFFQHQQYQSHWNI